MAGIPEHLVLVLVGQRVVVPAKALGYSRLVVLSHHYRLLPLLLVVGTVIAVILLLFALGSRNAAQESRGTTSTTTTTDVARRSRGAVDVVGSRTYFAGTRVLSVAWRAFRYAGDVLDFCISTGWGCAAEFNVTWVVWWIDIDIFVWL